MEAQAAFVGADGAVELHTVAAVHMDLTVVIHPGDGEGEVTLGHGHTLQQSLPTVNIFIFFHNGTDGFQNLFHSLVKLRLAGILLPHTLLDLINITHKKSPPKIRLGLF